MRLQHDTDTFPKENGPNFSYMIKTDKGMVQHYEMSTSGTHEYLYSRAKYVM